MARKLKTYQTSIGFFDLAVAAPSMKAAADAWGARTDIFKKGFAKETHDQAIVAGTMAKPGVVLKRPVGSDDQFSETAELPHLPTEHKKPATPKAKATERSAQKFDAKAANEVFRKEQKQREIARRIEEAERDKRRKLREKRIAQAEKALKDAERNHVRRVKDIESKRTIVERQSEAEDARWAKQRERLEKALRKARE